MLLHYVGLFSADVARDAPIVATLQDKLEARREDLLAVLATLPTLTGRGRVDAARSPGRTAQDWQELPAWYPGRRGRSGPAQLEPWPSRAVGQLIANAKRMLAAARHRLVRRGR